MPDNNLMFYLAGCIFFLWQFISRRKAKPRDEIIKIKSTKTDGMMMHPKDFPNDKKDTYGVFIKKKRDKQKNAG